MSLLLLFTPLAGEVGCGIPDGFTVLYTWASEDPMWVDRCPPWLDYSLIGGAIPSGPAKPLYLFAPLVLRRRRVDDDDLIVIGTL